MIYNFGNNRDGFAPDAQQWDLCIVGAGAAGLALAAQFLGTSWRVLVLESGLSDPDAAGNDLNTLESVGLRHDGWRDGRRQLQKLPFLWTDGPVAGVAPEKEDPDRRI